MRPNGSGLLQCLEDHWLISSYTKDIYPLLHFAIVCLHRRHNILIKVAYPEHDENGTFTCSWTTGEEHEKSIEVILQTEFLATKYRFILLV